MQWAGMVNISMSDKPIVTIMVPSPEAFTVPVTLLTM